MTDENEKQRPRARARSAPGSILRSTLSSAGQAGFIGELNDLLARTPVDLHRLASAVRGYPDVTAQVLRFCNASLFPIEPVTSVEEAVVLLGVERLRTVVLACHFRAYSGQHVPEGALKAFWRHSYSVALLARLIAGSVALVPADEAHLAGLVHDIGYLPLLRDPALLDEAETTSADQRLEVERERFGTDHCELGRILAAGWKLPDQAAQAIEWHHAPRPAEYGSLAAVVAAADRFSRLHGLIPSRLGLAARSFDPAPLRSAGEQMLAVCLPQIGTEQRVGLFDVLQMRLEEIMARPEFEGWPEAEGSRG